MAMLQTLSSRRCCVPTTQGDVTGIPHVFFVHHAVKVSMVVQVVF